MLTCAFEEPFIGMEPNLRISAGETHQSCGLAHPLENLDAGYCILQPAKTEHSFVRPKSCHMKQCSTRDRNGPIRGSFSTANVCGASLDVINKNYKNYNVCCVSDAALMSQLRRNVKGDRPVSPFISALVWISPIWFRNRKLNTHRGPGETILCSYGVTYAGF